ncbi:MAG: heme-binding protein, partial [Pyrinomonadaceae bacterium]
MNAKILVKKCEFFAGFVILLLFGVTARSQSLSLSDVQIIIAQAVSKAVALNQKVTVSVTDKEGNLLGTFAMTGTTPTTLIRSVGRAGQGLENVVVPAAAAANSKAGTAGIFSAGGNAFTTRTASFIIQEHFPPGIGNRPGGPLYGVQFSTLPCSDIA